MSLQSVQNSLARVPAVPVGWEDLAEPKRHQACSSGIVMIGVGKNEKGRPRWFCLHMWNDFTISSALPIRKILFEDDAKPRQRVTYTGNQKQFEWVGFQYLVTDLLLHFGMT